MSVPSFLVLTWLGQATAAVTLAAAAVWLSLRLTRVQSPAVHRWAWLAVVLQGIVLWRMPVELPVLPATDLAIVAAPPVNVPDGQCPNDDLHIHSQYAGPAGFEEAAFASPWPSVVLAAWLCGIVVAVTLAGIRYFAFCRLLVPFYPAPLEWNQELRELCAELAIPRGRVLLQVTEQLGPALSLLPSGYRLLVPRSQWRGLSAVQRRAILRHELAHYVRGDLWKSLSIRVLALPQWFNPLVWYAVRRFEDAAEWACDDAVQAGEQDQVFDYLRALVYLGGPPGGGTSLQAAVRGGSLQFRVRRLSLPFRKDSPMKKFAIAIVILIVAAAGMTQLRLATAQTPTAAKKSESAPASAEKTAGDTPTNPASVGPATAPPSATEAVLDLSRVFKESHAFQRQKKALSSKMSRWQQVLKQEHERIAVMQQKLRAISDDDQKRLLEIELQILKTDLEQRTERLRKEVQDEELVAYQETFEQVRAEVAQYARQHGIRLVRQLKSVVVPGKAVDATDRTAVLQNINRDIIYSDPQLIDITDAIIERLNADGDDQ